MGRDKAFEPFGKGTLLDRVLSRLSLFKNDIILVGNTRQDLSRFTNKNTRVVIDLYPEKGPIGGIYTGLKASNTQYNLVVACDMPFLNAGLLCYLVQQCSNYDAVVPSENDHYEPLHAVYSRTCIKPLEELMSNAEMQLIKLFEMVRVKYVESDEIRSFDPHRISFFNINNEEDLKKARNLDALESSLWK